MSEKIYSVEEIKNIVAPIAERYGLDKVFLFGSYARNTAGSDSDIDLCVDAAHIRGMFAMGALYTDLEDSLEKRLDLITTNSLKYNKDARFLQNLRRDQVLIYERS